MNFSITWFADKDEEDEWNLNGSFRSGYAPTIRMDPNDSDPGAGDEIEFEQAESTKTKEKMSFDAWFKKFGFKDSDLDKMMEQVSEEMRDSASDGGDY